MKILLIVPPVQYGFQNPAFLSSADWPVGFAYIAAVLKREGHSVIGLDLNNREGYPSGQAMAKAEIEGALEKHKPDCNAA